jgi:hypothetical protein
MVPAILPPSPMKVDLQSELSLDLSATLPRVLSSGDGTGFVAMARRECPQRKSPHPRSNAERPGHPPAHTMPTLPPQRLSENKPATSAITSLRDIELTERRHGYQNNFFLLWTRPKNRTTVEVRIHTSAPSSRRPCLALHRSAPPVQLPPNHRKSISACRCDESVIANSNVTSKRRIKPVRSISCAPRGRLRRAGCAQCVLLIEQF